MNSMLESRLRNGEFSAFGFEAMRLEIGDGVTYTPDFVVWKHDGTLLFIEVKGPRIEEDSIVKWKSAKGRYKLAKWEMWQLAMGEWTQIG